MVSLVISRVEQECCTSWTTTSSSWWALGMRVQGVVCSHIHNSDIVACPFKGAKCVQYLVWVHVLLTGPAKCLFEKPYFEQKKAALKPGGIICSMGKQDIVGGYDLALIMPQYSCCVMQRLKMRLA